MDFSGTLLSPLYPLIQFLQPLIALFAGEEDKDEDEPGNSEKGQQSDKGDAGENGEGGGDDGEEDEEEDDDEAGDGDEDDLDDELPADEATRRNAARLDSEKEEQLSASMEALVDLLVENPTIAEKKLETLRNEQPVLAAKLARMFKNRQNNKLGDLLEGADDAVKTAFNNLLGHLKEVEKKTEQQQAAADKRMYKEWESKEHPYLNPKSAEGKTKLGKKLTTEFYAALDRIGKDDQPLDEDMLEDALAMAKRRVGWNDKRVKRAVDKFAVEQAAKGRGVTAGKNGKGVNSGEKSNADPEVAAMFNRKGNAEHLKKVAEAKKAAGFK